MRIVGKTNVNIITGNKYECGGNISSYKDNPIKTFEYSYVYFFFIFFQSSPSLSTNIPTRQQVSPSTYHESFSVQCMHSQSSSKIQPAYGICGTRSCGGPELVGAPQSTSDQVTLIMNLGPHNQPRSINLINLRLDQVDLR